MKATKVCEQCGNEFHLDTSPANIKRQRYCSKECVSAKLRVIPEFDERMAQKLKDRASRQPNGCINYTGQNNGSYGQIEYRRKTYLAHRVAYQLAHGNIPDGMFVCHSCDNRLCINPDHLWLGSARDNVVDMVIKGRGRYNPRKKLSDEAMDALRHEILSGETQRALAAKYGVSQSYISMLKSGQRRISN